MERKLKLVEGPEQPRKIPNLDRAAELLADFRRLWSHPGVTGEQREALLKEVFNRISIDGKGLTAYRTKASLPTPLCLHPHCSRVGVSSAQVYSVSTSSTDRTPPVHRWTAEIAPPPSPLHGTRIPRLCYDVEAVQPAIHGYHSDAGWQNGCRWRALDPG